MFAEVLPLATVVICSADFRLPHGQPPEVALLEDGPAPLAGPALVAVSAGGRPLRWWTREGTARSRCPPSTPRTLSAPGTCSTARTLSGSATGQDPVDALRLAVRVASLKVGHVGPRSWLCRPAPPHRRPRGDSGGRHDRRWSWTRRCSCGPAASPTQGGRRILGITGPPGAGKSTLAEALAASLGERAELVGMDGFHLAEAELRRLGPGTARAPRTPSTPRVRRSAAAPARRGRADRLRAVLRPVDRGGHRRLGPRPPGRAARHHRGELPPRPRTAAGRRCGRCWTSAGTWSRTTPNASPGSSPGTNGSAGPPRRPRTVDRLGPAQRRGHRRDEGPRRPRGALSAIGRRRASHGGDPAALSPYPPTWR